MLQSWLLEEESAHDFEIIAVTTYDEYDDDGLKL